MSIVKTYEIERELKEGTVQCWVVERRSGGSTLSRELLHHWKVHSPTGFECGQGGSGPLDLALSILSDHLGVPADFDYATAPFASYPIKNFQKAWSFHHQFRDDFIAQLPATGGEILATEVAAWVEGRFQDAPGILF